MSGRLRRWQENRQTPKGGGPEEVGDKVPTFDFIQRDLDDADRCDIMVVYLPMLSAGACMELFYAKRKGKRIIIVSEIEC